MTFCNLCYNTFSPVYNDLHIITCCWDYTRLVVKIPDQSTGPTRIWCASIRDKRQQVTNPQVNIAKFKRDTVAAYTLVAPYYSCSYLYYLEFLEELNNQLMKYFNVELPAISK